MTSRRDVEQDIRDRLVREARGYPRVIADQQTTPDAAIGLLVRTAFGSAERLMGAVEQLWSDDPDTTEALALLTRAVRRAEDPQAPEPPPRRPPPDASRLHEPEAPEPEPGAD